jgi:two-component system alkaline phosphatase synthesis response regulator PhoP
MSQQLIYIIEDDESIRELVKMALASFSYEVFGFANAEDALTAINEKLPDLVIFDIMLPKMSGLEATKKLRQNEKTKNLPIILLTAKDTELDKVKGLDSGADDYIAKPFGIMELAARVRSVLRRAGLNSASSSNLLTCADLQINLETREVTKNNKKIELTFKEFELLAMLVRNKDRVVTREELLNSIWGFEYLGETRTLDMHIRTLRQKLEDSADNPQYIKTIRSVGYRFMENEESL